MIVAWMRNFKEGQDQRGFHLQNWLMPRIIFNDEEKLGQGGFGGVYRGFLRDSNSFVAVKRVSKGSKQGLKE